MFSPPAATENDQGSLLAALSAMPQMTPEQRAYLSSIRGQAALLQHTAQHIQTQTQGSQEENQSNQRSRILLGRQQARIPSAIC